jgi:hypothetical protein
MNETIVMLNLRIGLNEDQYSKLRYMAESNRSESVEKELEKILIDTLSI